MTKGLDALKLINFIENTNFFITKALINKKILIAFSGGQDSLSLLTLFYILSQKWGFRVSAVYCHHCWKDSEEAVFRVFQILQKFDIPFYLVETPNSQPMKPEQKARNWRYSSFYNILKFDHYDFVLTGHSLTDGCETLLFNLIRGSGLKGLCSLKEAQIFQKFEKSDFFFKKTTFFLDSLSFIKESKNPGFGLFKVCVNTKLRLRTEKSRSKSFFALKKETFFSLGFPFFVGKERASLFYFYRQKLRIFQKKNASSSFICFFKPLGWEKKSGQKIFLSLKMQKLMEKKKKEKIKKSFRRKFLKVKFEKKNFLGLKWERFFFFYFYPLRQNKNFYFAAKNLPFRKSEALFFRENFFFTFYKKIFSVSKDGSRKVKNKASFSQKKKLCLNTFSFFANPFKKILPFYCKGKFFIKEDKHPLFQKNLLKQVGNLPSEKFVVFRPLLKIKRETLLLFSQNLGLPVYYDKSNKELNLTRNFIRKLIFPLLKKINPRVEENLYKFSKILEFYYEQVGEERCPPERLEIFRP